MVEEVTSARSALLCSALSLARGRHHALRRTMNESLRRAPAALLSAVRPRHAQCRDDDGQSPHNSAQSQRSLPGTMDTARARRGDGAEQRS